MTSPVFDYDSYVTTLLTAINGNQPITVRYETTSDAVAQQYNVYIQAIAAVYNKAATVSSTGVITKPVLTNDDVTAINNALTGLKNLATQGIADPSTGYIYFLNQQMSTNLDQLLRTFNSVGYNGSALTLTQLTSWKDLTTLSSNLTAILQTGLDAYTANRSLQALIELEYVGTANDLINDKLSDMQTALQTTSNALNTLAAVQSLHNQIIFTNKASFDFNYDNNSLNAKDFYNAYKRAASDYFNGQISAQLPSDLYTYTITYISHPFLGVETKITFLPTAKGLSLINQMLVLKQSITQQLAQLSTILTATEKAGTGNLYNALKNVLNDLNSKFVTTGGGTVSAGTSNVSKLYALKNWLYDDYNLKDSSSAGNIQSNITNAITSAQSLNSTQQENVKNYIFVFEEYYKSASSVLQAITQIIQKMAQGIRS